MTGTCDQNGKSVLTPGLCVYTLGTQMVVLFGEVLDAVEGRRNGYWRGATKSRPWQVTAQPISCQTVHVLISRYNATSYILPLPLRLWAAPDAMPSPP